MIYFIRPVGQRRIKIGYTNGSIESRLSELQTGNPRPFEVLGLLPGDREDEKAYHEHFRRDRIQGEWFDPSPELIILVASLFKVSRFPLTFAYFAHLQPALWDLAVMAGCAEVRDGAGYFYETIKPKLCELVGYELEVAELTIRQRPLCTSVAYDVVYETLFRLIPDPLREEVDVF
jgi:hypothetical protein